MTMTETAAAFFAKIENGKGWAACAPFCTQDATFSCHADALAEVAIIEAYADWMQGLLKPMSNGHYEMKAYATDEARQTALGLAVFHGTHTADGGPVPPTGRTVAADYGCAMTFRDGRISHKARIWNEGHSLKALGWA